MFAVCWQLQLFCKVGFCVSGLCALQMCCNVGWAVRDFALNVLSLEGERNFVLGFAYNGYGFAMRGYLENVKPGTKVEQR